MSKVNELSCQRHVLHDDHRAQVIVLVGCLVKASILSSSFWTQQVE